MSRIVTKDDFLAELKRLRLEQNGKPNEKNKLETAGMEKAKLDDMKKSPSLATGDSETIETIVQDAKPRKKKVKIPKRSTEEIKEEIAYYRKAIEEAMKRELPSDIIEDFQDSCNRLEEELDEAYAELAKPDANGNIHIKVRFEIVPEEVKDEKKDDLDDEESKDSGAQDAAVDKNNVKTPYADCKAENPMLCRFHGISAMTDNFRKIMEENGLGGLQFTIKRVSDLEDSVVHELDFECPADKAETVGKAILRAFGKLPGIDLIDPDDALSMVERRRDNTGTRALFDITGVEKPDGEGETKKEVSEEKQDEKKENNGVEQTKEEEKGSPEEEKKIAQVSAPHLIDLPIEQVLAKDNLHFFSPSPEIMDELVKKDKDNKQRIETAHKATGYAWQDYLAKDSRYRRLFTKLKSDGRSDSETNADPLVVATRESKEKAYKYWEEKVSELKNIKEKCFERNLFFDLWKSCGWDKEKRSVLNISKISPIRKNVMNQASDVIEMMFVKDILPGESIIVEAKGKGRSDYTQSLRRIRIGPETKASSCVHECGHFAEYNNLHLHERCVEFLEFRTKGEKEQKLSKLLPKMGYRPDEVAKKDNFPSPYCGKIYRDYNGEIYATEILSTGIQYLYREPISFYQKDPEYFNFICGLVRGRI